MEKEGMNKTVVLKSILWLCLGIIFILPVFLIIMNAFKPNNDILTSFISFPKSLYLENFSEAMRIMNFWTVFRNTLLVTVCTVIVASAVSFMSAYGISHLPQKTGDKLYTLFVVGQIIPFHAVMIAISMLSTKLGLTNTHLGLIIFYSGFYTSFGVMTYVGFLKSVPRELEEAAAIDGAGRWKRMLHITLPGLKTVIVLMTILALGNILNAGFDQIYNLYNQAVYSTGDIIDTWVYRVGLNDMQFSLATAVGLLKSVAGFLLISSSYYIANKKANYTIF